MKTVAGSLVVLTSRVFHFRHISVQCKLKVVIYYCQDDNIFVLVI